jgi:hypothetical protein
MKGSCGMDQIKTSLAYFTREKKALTSNIRIRVCGVEVYILQKMHRTALIILIIMIKVNNKILKECFSH